MENLNASAVDSRMEWTASALNKVDVEEMTASNPGGADDGEMSS